MTTTRTDTQLRMLLHTARRAARLSQGAAATRAGVSRTWWRKVETAAQITVNEDTLIEMLEAVGIQPTHLEAIDRAGLAASLRKRQEFDLAAARPADLETYLMEAPAPEEVRIALVITARTMHEITTTHTAEDEAKRERPSIR